MNFIWQTSDNLLVNSQTAEVGSNTKGIIFNGIRPHYIQLNREDIMKLLSYSPTHIHDYLLNLVTQLNHKR